VELRAIEPNVHGCLLSATLMLVILHFIMRAKHVSLPLLYRDPGAVSQRDYSAKREPYQTIFGHVLHEKK
jgi:hypothetical protein